MSWHEALSLEIGVVFHELGGGNPWLRAENAFWQASRGEGFSRWAEHGLWWRHTKTGREYMAGYQRKRVTRLREQVVAIRGCAACGKPFEVTAYRRERRRDRVCSRQCRGALRGNIRRISIGRESLPLVRWCERYGIRLSTAWSRIKKGWSAKRAVTTPAINRGKSNRRAA